MKLLLPVYSLEEAKGKLAAGAEIIYLGWLMAGTVKGYKPAVRRYRIRAVGAVGMAATGKMFVQKLEDKLDRSPEEDAMLDMLLHGGDYVREENLAELLQWYETR